MTISRRTLLAAVGAGAVAAATGITVAAEAVETTTAVPAGPELFPAQLPAGTSPSVGHTSLYQTVVPGRADANGYVPLLPGPGEQRVVRTELTRVLTQATVAFVALAQLSDLHIVDDQSTLRVSIASVV